MSSGSRVEWVKPIMFSGGIGKVFVNHACKDTSVKPNISIVRVGGPTYRIGIGGGSASSTSNNAEELKLQAAVQRGDAQMENRMDRWLRSMLYQGYDMPLIRSVHDQGAGGMGNVTKEIVGNCGGIINLEMVSLGDPTLTDAEIWTAESQEQITVLLSSSSMDIARLIALRERVPFDVVGKTKKTGKMQVWSSKTEDYVVDLPLSK